MEVEVIEAGSQFSVPGSQFSVRAACFVMREYRSKGSAGLVQLAIFLSLPLSGSVMAVGVSEFVISITLAALLVSSVCAGGGIAASGIGLAGSGMGRAGGGNPFRTRPFLRDRISSQSRARRLRM